MDKTLFQLVCIVFFISCGQRTNFILPEDKMVDILMDLHVAEAAIANTDPAKKDSLSSIYDNQIFTLHHATQKEFKACLKQYQQEPAKLEKVYKKVTDKLNQKVH